MADAEEALAEDSPVLLLTMASALVEASTARPPDSFPGFAVDRPDPSQVFLSLTDTGWPGLGAVALAAAPLLADRVLASKIRLALDPAIVASGPRWLADLDRITITDTLVHEHLLGDGDNIIVSWVWPGGEPGTAVVYIDHNAGTAVKDAFVLGDAAGDVVALYHDLDASGHSRIGPIDPAAARARIAQAIERFDHTVPPFETDTWPACRPVVEWLVGRLPEGGVGYVRPLWSPEDQQELVEGFSASPHVRSLRGLSKAQIEALAGPLVWFACDYGPGDPLRWSPVSVEFVLTGWYLRKVVGLPETDLARLPEVLSAFVRFAHEHRRVPRELTTDTVRAVSRWADAFRADLAGSASRTSNTSRSHPVVDLDDLVDLDLDDPDLDFLSIDDVLDLDDVLHLDLHDLGLAPPGRGQASDADDDAFMARLIEDLERQVTALAGGPQALATLTDEPLAEVAFDWSSVPDPHREAAAATLDLLDRWASDLFDDEVRTIARAVLAAVAANDPAALIRSKKPDSLAAAILGFLLRRLSARFTAGERSVMLPWRVFTQRELAASTGVSASSISTRAATVAGVIERAPLDWPSVLHSTQRAELIRSRELIAQWRAEHLGPG